MVVPVEVATAESEVNLDDILGPADDQYEAILEQQRIDFDATRKNGKDDDDHEVYRDDDNVPRKIEMRSILFSFLKDPLFSTSLLNEFTIFR